MTPKLLERNKFVREGEPTADEIAAAGRGTFKARIGSNLGQPSDAVARMLHDVYGEPMDPTRLFLVPAELSNNLPDSYYTYMLPETLERYVVQAKQGRALMLAHDYMDLPVGQSFDGTTEKLQEAESTRLLRDWFLSHRRSAGLDMGRWAGGVLQNFYCVWYITRGGAGANKPNDAVIDSIETRTYRDVSIGFTPGRMRCDLCGENIMSWDCPHLPGAEYDANNGTDQTVICLAGVENGDMNEGSFVVKGATPDAAVIPVKARMIAATQRLSQDEARVVSELEMRVGVRLLDPRHLERAWTVIPLSNIAQAPEHTGTGTTGTQHKEASMVKRTGGTTAAGAGAGAGTRGTRQTDPAAVEDAVAQAAEDVAQALADRIPELDTQIAALEQEIVGVQEQIDGLSAATEVDNTEAIAGLQTQKQALEIQLDALKAERDTVQAELDAQNGLAEATGGTPVEAPAADAPAATETPAAPPQGNTIASSPAARMRAALTQALGIVRNNVLPNRVALKRITTEEAQPILDLLNQLTAEVQALITDAGAEPPVTNGVRIILDKLRAATGERSLSFTGVTRMVNDAAAGKHYLARLRDECARAYVRSHPHGSGDVERYKRMIATLPASDLEKELEDGLQSAGDHFTAGRSVLSALIPQDATATDKDPAPKPVNNGNGAHDRIPTLAEQTNAGSKF
jgi:chaperonin cofactor prefoldin